MTVREKGQKEDGRGQAGRAEGRPGGRGQAGRAEGWPGGQRAGQEGRGQAGRARVREGRGRKREEETHSLWGAVPFPCPLLQWALLFHVYMNECDIHLLVQQTLIEHYVPGSVLGRGHCTEGSR